MKVFELNLDGLVGPTHHYAGLSRGNLASINNAQTSSNPQSAALQGLEKMRLLHSLGLKQGLLIPHQRPNLHLLAQLGFTGTAQQQINKAYKTEPGLLSACYSASSMWAANTATVSPSSDTQDQKVHFTAANLMSNLHRKQETQFSSKLLQTLFANPDYFNHHASLPSSNSTGDEGAANHNRLGLSHGDSCINLFVFGRQYLKTQNMPSPQLFPARQSKEACQAIARKHKLHPEQVLFACQNVQAIDQGVFHNDVISVANEYVFLTHAQAFQEQDKLFAELRKKASFPLNIIELSPEQLSIKDAVDSYLFNSQLLTLPDQGNMLLVAPIECEHHPKVKACIDDLLADTNNPINKVLYLDLKQSMRNGGGPACLRLRVPLKESELGAMNQNVLVHENLLKTLEQWILKHYRTQLHSDDLRDIELMYESFQALDELTQILNLGSIYPFQQEVSI